MTAPAPATVDLQDATARALPMLLTGPTRARVRTLWATARAARKLGAEDVVIDAFLRLAVEVNLINARGWWTSEDVRPDLRRHGRQDVTHVLNWAMRNRNPFERL